MAREFSDPAQRSLRNGENSLFIGPIQGIACVPGGEWFSEYGCTATLIAGPAIIVTAQAVVNRNPSPARFPNG
jgi:hypothetical protein